MQGDGRTGLESLTIIGEYDPNGNLIWLSQLLGDCLGVNYLMMAGENLGSFLPSPLRSDLKNNLEKVRSSPQNAKAFRLDIPALKQQGYLKCYHLPNFDDSDQLASIKIVCDLKL